jgi:hypothetical protein
LYFSSLDGATDRQKRRDHFYNLTKKGLFVDRAAKLWPSLILTYIRLRRFRFLNKKIREKDSKTSGFGTFHSILKEILLLLKNDWLLFIFRKIARSGANIALASI